MMKMKHSWVPQRRPGVWVVVLIMVATVYYALWAEAGSAGRFRTAKSGGGSGSGGGSAATHAIHATHDAAEAANATDADESDLRAELPGYDQPARPAHATSAPAPAGSSAPAGSGAPGPWRPPRAPEYFTDLPAEYELATEDDELCRRFYTDQYVYGIANSSTMLCREGSAVHGFDVPTNPHHHKLNVATPVYLMQGVRWDPEARRFRAQCGEATTVPPTVYGQPLPGLSYGAPPSPACDRHSPGRQLVVYPALKETYDNVWHKLMELWQNKLSYDAARIAVDPATGRPFLAPEQMARARVVFPDDHEGPWDDAWEMLTGRPPARYSDLDPDACYDVVVGTAGWGGPFWSALLKTTYETCRRETLLTAFTRWVFAFYGIRERPSSDVRERPTITVVQRARTRKFRDLDRLLERMHAQYPGHAINVVDLALMGKREQITLLQGTDVLVGHHGAGMSYVMFMRPDSAVVEILPPFFLSRGFRWVARMRGLVHFIGRAMWKEEYMHAVEGVPVPVGWKPAYQADGDADGWQSEEWIWITHDEVLGLVDAAVKSQLHAVGDRV